MKKIRKSKYFTYYDAIHMGWRVLVEGLQISDCPILFTDQWIHSVNHTQRKIILKVLQEYHI